MGTIIGSSGWGCVLVISIELYGTKAGLFDGNLLPQPSYWKKN